MALVVENLAMIVQGYRNGMSAKFWIFKNVQLCKTVSVHIGYDWPRRPAGL